MIPDDVEEFIVRTGHRRYRELIARDPERWIAQIRRQIEGTTRPYQEAESTAPDGLPWDPERSRRAETCEHRQPRERQGCCPAEVCTLETSSYFGERVWTSGPCYLCRADW